MTNKQKSQHTPLVIRNHTFDWGQRTYLMGILNVTPDSFSDGGKFNQLESALNHAQDMINNGANIIDIGGESTRPNAEAITLEEELNRVIPVIESLRQTTSIPISIDTTKAKVARAAIEAGADIVNDISGGTFDNDMLLTVAQLQVPIILMHMRGTPKTMQKLTEYNNLITEIYNFLDQQIQKATTLGIKKSRIIIDPGIGFAKTHQQNVQILQSLAEFQPLNVPILVGTSRKSFIGHILQNPNPQARIWGTAATCCSAIARGADILRVHDLAQMRDVSRVADAIWRI
ncbi:MAG: dihydropteroate synthase [Xenococcaceae cyanobacterium MO_188.B32]|nr:dihydropteroate synthase [Xenococcaceae cyanobacterium MO_188.B32]